MTKNLSEYKFSKHGNSKKNVKSHLAGVTQRRIDYHWLWGPMSTTCSNATEVAQWATPSCSRPQPATDNGVRDGRSNRVAVNPSPLMGSNP